jgi:antitoxin (DNA-binding transcriptional repressor) of toxin-antitoxin stability system
MLGKTTGLESTCTSICSAGTGWKSTKMTRDKGKAMTSIRVEDAQAKLAELIAQLKPGEALEITKNHEVVAKIVCQKNARQFGLGKGKLKIVVEDDEHLGEFKEYMP